MMRQIFYLLSYYLNKERMDKLPFIADRENAQVSVDEH